MAPVKQPNLISHLEKYATRFFATLIVLICFLMFYFGPMIAPDYKAVFISVSTSLFASLIFAIIYSFVVDKHHLSAVNDQLSQSVKQAVNELKQIQQENVATIANLMQKQLEDLEKSHYHQISLHFRELIPSNYFPPTNQPDQRFNEILNAALANSRQYLFKGVTGRYIPSRLLAVEHHNLTCKILLIDPENEDLLRMYIRDRFGGTQSHIEITQRVQSVKKEIYMTIVDLFDQARWKSIDIRMYDGPIFYRTEILDEQLFISYFTEKTSTAFPTTYLYMSDSFFYNAFLTDFNQTFELASIFTTFNPRSTEQDLINFLTKIKCDIRELAQLRNEAENFRREFLNTLKERKE